MANLTILSTVLNLATAVTSNLFANKETAEAAKTKVTGMVVDGTLTPHIDNVISAIKADSGPQPTTVSNSWRPATGATVTITALYSGVIQPILSWVCVLKGWPAPPALSLETLSIIGSLGGILAGLRTYEKKTGTAA